MIRVALAIPTGVPIKVANDAIEILPLVADKTMKNFNNENIEKAIYLLSLLLINSLSLISATK